MTINELIPLSSNKRYYIRNFHNILSSFNFPLYSTPNIIYNTTTYTINYLLSIKPCTISINIFFPQKDYFSIQNHDPLYADKTSLCDVIVLNHSSLEAENSTLEKLRLIYVNAISRSRDIVV